MADAKVSIKKSQKHRRIRRRESWAREEKEIKELEDRCREVSCRFLSLHRGFTARGTMLIFLWSY